MKLKLYSIYWYSSEMTEEEIELFIEQGQEYADKLSEERTDDQWKIQSVEYKTAGKMTPDLLDKIIFAVTPHSLVSNIICNRLV